MSEQTADTRVKHSHSSDTESDEDAPPKGWAERSSRCESRGSANNTPAGGILARRERTPREVFSPLSSSVTGEHTAWSQIPTPRRPCEIYFVRRGPVQAGC